jgi:outer membrane lipoprotein SlyB
MNNIQRILIVPALAASLAGCAALQPQQGPASYSSGAAMQVQQVYLAQVVAVRRVHIMNRSQGQTVGGLGGAGVGAGVGALLGGNLGAVVGGLVGGVGGSVIGASADSSKGFLITVELKNHKILAVTQKTIYRFKVGEKVEITISRSNTGANGFFGQQSSQKVRVVPFN